MKSLLLICTGNICRSPVAEAWFRSQCGDILNVTSAGTHALINHPADPLAIKVASENGLDISQHRAKQVTIDLIQSANLILVMEAAHRSELIRFAPWATGKIWRLGQAKEVDVLDPYGGTKDAFIISFLSIKELSQPWLEHLRST